MKILILTKNILAEKSKQQKLQTLGHEVFVSSKYLKDYLEHDPDRKIINQFNVCVISKTISDRETNELFSKFHDQTYNFLREVEEIPEVLIAESHKYVLDNASLVELREAIAYLVEKVG